MRMLLGAVLMLSCAGASGSDSGMTGAGGGGGGNAQLDAGYANPLPEVFESAYGRAVAVHGGKVYVAGNGIRSDAGTNNDFFIARFGTDLVRDTSFGTDGVGLAIYDGGVIAIFPWDNDRPFALSFDGDRPVLAGNVRGYSLDTGDFGVARFTATGQLDSTFGMGGLRAESYGGSHPASATAIAVQPDGKLLVGGVIANGSRGDDLALLRYTSSGTIDTSFTLLDAGAGAVIDFGAALGEETRGLFIQPNGNVLLGGGSGFSLARLTSSGQFDLTFGSGTGKVSNGNGRADKLVQRSDGSIWMVGAIELSPDGGPGTGKNFLKQVLVTADGVPVASFGQNGRRTDLINEYGAIRGAALQGDGKLLVYYAFISQGRLLRLNVDGSLDTSFGTAGVMQLDIFMPLFEGGAGKGNHLTIDGSTAFITDINVVQVTPSRSREYLALVKVSL